MGKQGAVRTAIPIAGAPRIRVWSLVQRLLLSLVLPVSVALLLDWALGTLPWLTMAASLLCIPLATLIVGNATLREFERVVALVAPYEAETSAADEGAAKHFEAVMPDEAPPNVGRPSGS